MIPYYVFGLIAVLVCWLGTSIGAALVGRGMTKTEDPIFSVLNVIATTTVLVLFSGLRFGVGTDYSMYARFFQIADPESYSNSLQTIPQEAGFVGLMYLVRSVSDQPWVFFTTCAVLTVVPLLWAIRRCRVNPVLAVFTYVFLTYYTSSFNAVRQSIAVSFVLLADTYRSKGSWIRFVLCNAVAIGFHYSAIIAIVIQLGVSRVNISMKIAFVVLLLGAPAASLLLQQGWMRGLIVAVNSRYGTYLDEADAAGTGTLLMAVIRVVVVFMLIIVMRHFDDVEQRERRWLSFTLLSAVALLLGSVTMEMTRLEPYFGVFLVVLIPSLIARLRNRGGVVLLFAVFSLVYFGIHTAAYNGLVPYVGVIDLWTV